MPSKYTFEHDIKAFRCIERNGQPFHPYLVDDDQGPKRVILAESHEAAASQCGADISNVKPIAFCVRGWGEEIFPPAPAVKTVRINEAYEAVIHEDHIKVGCQTISKEIVEKIYAAMHGQPEYREMKTDDPNCPGVFPPGSQVYLVHDKRWSDLDSAAEPVAGQSSRHRGWGSATVRIPTCHLGDNQ